MHYARLATSLAFALALPASAANPPFHSTGFEEVITMRVEGNLSIDARGNVVSHEVLTPITAHTREVIDRAVATWRFAPPMVRGEPVGGASSAMRVTLAGRKHNDSYAVSVDNVVFYDRAKDGKQARHAESAEKGGVSMAIVAQTRKVKHPSDFYANGALTMAIRANPDGTVAEVFPTQCSLYFAGGTSVDFARACRQMSAGAAAAIRTWKLRIELNGNVPSPRNLTATVPLRFHAYNRDMVKESALAGNWRMEARTPFQQAPWLANDRFAQRVGASDVDGSQGLLPARPTFQFASVPPGDA
jgi:hypothetical protein